MLTAIEALVRNRFGLDEEKGNRTKRRWRLMSFTGFENLLSKMMIE
jgi:hypothetical protein